MLLGAPHVEGLRRNAGLSAALPGVTAAVGGVIANLSVFFAIHTLFGDARFRDWGPVHITAPEWSTISPRAVVVTVLAFVLVFRLRWSVLRVLGPCAAVSAAIHLAAH